MSARTLLDSRGLTPLTTIAQAKSALGMSGSVLRFWVSQHRVFVWHISEHHVRVATIEIDADRLSSLIESFRRGVMDGKRDEGSIDAGRELYQRFVQPFLESVPQDSTLAIVPDGAFCMLPFGALDDSRRPLVSRTAIVEAPSTTLLLQQRPVVFPPSESAPIRALLVGNPTLDRTLFSTLAPLPNSEREIRDIAALYKEATVLIGADATRTRFLSSASSHAVVHFAGHAVPNELYPMFSLLALGADRAGASGAVFAKDIANLKLRGTELVVLAACATGAGRISKGGEGVLSLARPFLAAGVTTVIASLWPVEDRATAALMSRLHRRYIATLDAVRALRDAQLDMIASGDPELQQPRAWAGFVVIGSLNVNRTPSKERP